MQGQGTGWEKVSFIPFLPRQLGHPSRRVGQRCPSGLWSELACGKTPNPGAPPLLAQHPAGLGERMGFACPSQVRKPRQRERVRGGSKTRPTPGNGGPLRLVGLLAFLFPRLVCWRRRACSCVSGWWCHRQGLDTTVALPPKLTPADPSGQGLPHAPFSNTALSRSSRV